MLDADASGKPRYEDGLKVAAGRHDLSVIKVCDPREKVLAPVGLVNMKDSETGRQLWVNTDSARVRRAWSQWFSTLSASEQQLFNRYKIGNVEISTDSDYVRSLMSFFAKR